MLIFSQNMAFFLVTQPELYPMDKIITAIALGLSICFFAAPAIAADAAACQASWNKMDAKKQGYVMNVDAQDTMDKMTKAGRKMAAPDRISDKEYMDACIADLFMTKT